jgi:hypothetical protein
MVLPDTPERDPSRSHRLPALGAVITMSVLAVLILGRLTSPTVPPDPSETATAPDSTTTTLLDPRPEIDAFTEHGQPLSWEGLSGIGDHRPLAIVELDGEAVIFTTPADHLVGEAGQISIREPWRYGGLDAWWPWQLGTELLARSTRVVAAGTLFQTIKPTSFGVLAMGVETATGVPSTWTSTNGLEWSRLDLLNPSGDPIYVYEAHVQGETTFLLAMDNPRAGWPYAREVALDRYGDAAFTMVQLTRDRYAVFGVLGLQLGVIPVPNEEPLAATARYLLRTEDGIAWDLVDLPDLGDAFLGDLVTSPDGGLWMLAYTFEGPVVYASPDGIGWVRHGDQTLTRSGGVYYRLAISRPWGEGNLMVTMDSSAHTKLLRSDDLYDWTEVFDFGTILSPSYGPRTWSLGAWDSGTQGIALVAQRVESADEFQDDEPIETLHKDGFSLEVTRHHVRLMGPGADITASRFYSLPHARIRFDLDDRSVVFLDVEGSDLVRFSFAELAAADVPSYPEAPIVSMSQAFLYSTDGTNWTVQDISEVTGGTWATHVALIGDRVFLVTDSGMDSQPFRGFDQGWILTARIP